MPARCSLLYMPKAGEPAYDDVDREMFDIIHDGGEGGGYEDGQVEDSDPT